MHIAIHPMNMAKEYNYEEYCPHCDCFIPIVIDNAEWGRYDLTCPVCGEQLMLCVLCRWDQENNNGGECDYREGMCFRRDRNGNRSAEKSNKDVAAATDVVITMLPNSPHVKAAVLGDEGVLAHKLDSAGHTAGSSHCIQVSEAVPHDEDIA